LEGNTIESALESTSSGAHNCISFYYFCIGTCVLERERDRQRIFTAIETGTGTMNDYIEREGMKKRERHPPL